MIRFSVSPLGESHTRDIARDVREPIGLELQTPRACLRDYDISPGRSTQSASEESGQPSSELTAVVECTTRIATGPPCDETERHLAAVADEAALGADFFWRVLRRLR